VIELYYDLGSPYAYLAFTRAERVLGVRPALRPIVLGPIFALRGRGSWARTDTRAEGIAEVERRAREYGLAPLRWHPGWPQNTLHAMRAVLWAERHDRAWAFTEAAFARAFEHGEDLSDHATLRRAAADAGLPEAELEAAIAAPAIKDELKARTEQAIARGVRGVPTFATPDALYYGDDALPSIPSSTSAR
jgi:2-hydroxychromene-2-carboxylate isomerase